MKSSWYKISYNKRPLPGEHVLFFSYRWIAWLIAAMAIFWPDQIMPMQQPSHTIWLVLLILTGIVNIVFTLTSESYVRILHRRPALFLLDVVVSLVVVWISNGQALPFLPYALGALVLPSLLAGWRGVLMASFLFVSIDAVALFLNRDLPPESWLVIAGLRAVIVIGFACMWLPLRWISHYGLPLPRLFTRHPSAWLTDADHTHTRLVRLESDPTTFPDVPPQRSPAERIPERIASDMSVAAQLTTIHALTERRHNQELEPTFPGKPVPLARIDLAVALNGIVDRFQADCHIDTQIKLIGVARQLSPVQYNTLFRLAQVSLSNIHRHARAQNAYICLEYDQHSVTLVVQDDGVGLLDGTYQRPGIHALRAISYCLAELDGRLEVFEGQQGGVTVRGVLPLETI